MNGKTLFTAGSDGSSPREEMDLRRARYTHGAVRRTDGRASDHAADRRSDIGLTRAFHPAAATAPRRTIHSSHPPFRPRPSPKTVLHISHRLADHAVLHDVPSVRRLSDIQIRHSQIMTSKTRRHHSAPHVTTYIFSQKAIKNQPEAHQQQTRCSIKLSPPWSFHQP